MVKYQFNIEPVIIEAESEKEAWDKYESGEFIYDVRYMEEIE